MIELGILVILGIAGIAAFTAKEQGKNWILWFALGLLLNIFVFAFLKEDEVDDYQ